MQIESLAIADVKLLTPRVFADSRGWFSETWNARTLASVGIEATFVQDNQAFSAAAGTVRGLHFQRAPHAQDKLVRVLVGAVLDVAVDIRPGSPTFGQHVAVELSAENHRQLWVPKGFAHGYRTLTPDTVMAYKVAAFYAPAADAGILWSDPDLAIDWGLDATAALLSDKDQRMPRLRDIA